MMGTACARYLGKSLKSYPILFVADDQKVMQIFKSVWLYVSDSDFFTRWIKLWLRRSY